MTLEVLSFILGGLLVFSGIVGGGLEIRELKVPKLNSTTRLMAVFGGLAFIILGLVVRVQDSGPPEVATPEGSTSIFHDPMIGEYRLDWCYTWAHNCGYRAATAWCTARGYGEAVHFVKDADVGVQGVVTKLIGSGQLCEKTFCDAFISISCQ